MYILAALLPHGLTSMISFAGGSPNEDLFYFKEAEFKLRFVLTSVVFSRIGFLVQLFRNKLYSPQILHIVIL